MIWTRRRFLHALCGALLLPNLPGCRSQQPLTVASHVWPGYELIFLARSEGWFSHEDVHLLETNSATDSLAALREGRADGAALTLDEVLRARAEGMALTVVLVFDVSMGADVVMSDPAIVNLQGLAGKRIGVESSALGAYMLEMTLREAHLDPSCVVVVPLCPDKHLAAWQGRKVDALVTYEPVATQLEGVGMQRIFDSRKIPESIFDVLAIKTEALPTRSRAARSLVLGHFKALGHLRTNPRDAAYRMTSRLRLQADDVLTSFRGLELPTLSANWHYLDGSAPILLGAAQRMAEVMQTARIISSPPPLTGLIDTDLLPHVGSLP